MIDYDTPNQIISDLIITVGIKLGSPQNLTKIAREKSSETIRQNRQDNEIWRRAITYIEHYQMK